MERLFHQLFEPRSGSPSGVELVSDVKALGRDQIDRPEIVTLVATTEASGLAEMITISQKLNSACPDQYPMVYQYLFNMISGRPVEMYDYSLSNRRSDYFTLKSLVAQLEVEYTQFKDVLSDPESINWMTPLIKMPKYDQILQYYEGIPYAVDLSGLWLTRPAETIPFDDYVTVLVEIKIIDYILVQIEDFRIDPAFISIDRNEKLKIDKYEDELMYAQRLFQISYIDKYEKYCKDNGIAIEFNQDQQYRLNLADNLMKKWIQTYHIDVDFAPSDLARQYNLFLNEGRY